MSVKIIPAQTRYSAGYCAVLNEVAAERLYLSVYGGFTPEGSENFSLFCRENGFPQFFAIDEETDRVVGWCDIVGRDTCPRTVGYLGIGLHADYRGMGLGRKLMECALDAAAEHGFRVVRLECREGNTRALAIYEKMGFRRYARKARGLEIDGEYFPVIYMKKRLSRRGIR